MLLGYFFFVKSLFLFIGNPWKRCLFMVRKFIIDDMMLFLWDSSEMKSYLAYRQISALLRTLIDAAQKCILNFYITK